MIASIFGLGVEGEKAIKSLINNGYKVYGTDSSMNIDLNYFEEIIKNNYKNHHKENLKKNQRNDIKIQKSENRINLRSDILNIDLGQFNEEILEKSNLIVLSPGLFKLKKFQKYLDYPNYISNILNKHKTIYTIAITGTNGKTTTISMLKDILTASGKKFLIGGNGGGGFNGYIDLVLESLKYDYDFILVEVCDMTIDFANNLFDFDLIGLTNIGNDHLNVHGSIENYENTVINAFKNKKIFLNKDDPFTLKYISKVNENFDKNKKYNKNEDIDLKDINSKDINLKDIYSNDFNSKIDYYNLYPYDLNIIGKFNKYNAGLAYSIAKELKIDEEIVINVLKNFVEVEGRLNEFKIKNKEITIGKTDNSHAVKAILSEKIFDIIAIGTPRDNEAFRLDILNEIILNYNYNRKDQNLIIFNGLSDNFNLVKERLNDLNFIGKLTIAENNETLVKFIKVLKGNQKIFIGGNGQENILKIQRLLEK